MGTEGKRRILLLADVEVIVELNDVVHSQGDRVRGEVTVIPHERGERVDLTLELREVWTETDDDEGSLTTRSRSAVRSRVELEGGKTESIVRKRGNAVHLFQGEVYPFVLPLPRNARVTGDACGWQLGVRQQHTRALPEADRVRLNVRPAEETQALIAALTGLRFRDSGKRRYDAQTSNLQLEFAPPAALVDCVEVLDVSVSVTDTGLAVTWRVDRRPISVADYFKELVGLDVVTQSFELTREDLFAEGRPNLDVLMPRLRDLLKQAIA